MPEIKSLVVEDNEINMLVICGMLETAFGIKSDCADSGEKAVAMAVEKDYDCIFMDLLMDGMDGFQAAAEIRKLLKDRRPVITALTASDGDEVRERLSAAGMDGFLKKPLEKEELELFLNKWFPGFATGADSGGAEAPHNAFLEKAAEIDGLNVKAGLENTAMNSGVYIKSLEILKDKYSESLKNLTERLESGLTEEFKVLIHGLKGSLSGVGFMRLSGLAKELEIKASQNDLDYCRNNFSGFSRGLEAVGEKLSALFESADFFGEPLKTGEKQRFSEIMTKAKTALGDYDYGQLSLIRDELSGLTFGAALDGSVKSFINAVNMFDYDAMDKAADEAIKYFQTKG